MKKKVKCLGLLCYRPGIPPFPYTLTPEAATQYAGYYNQSTLVASYQNLMYQQMHTQALLPGATSIRPGIGESFM